MAAATQPLLVNSNTDFQQSVNLVPFNRMVKKEVVDPAYSNSSPAPSSPQVEGNALLQKVKRAYTRKSNSKPAGTSAPPAKVKKVKQEPTENTANGSGSQSLIGDHMPVQKKKRDRFKGTTEEEVLTRVLPDHIKEDLDILIVGINPGLTAAYVQHHYAGPGNHFWKCLFLSGMIPEPMNAMQDAELMNFGIGFTNIVARTTRGSADLSRKEIAEGGEILKEKMLKYLPKIALFNGKGIYEVFCGHKKFCFGLQPDPFPGCPNTCVFVNPSSSARCTQLPRAVDKVPFYEALKRVRDHIRANGSIEGIDRSTVTFPDFKLVTAPQKNKVKEEPKEISGDAPLPQHKKEKAQQPTVKKAPKPRKPRASKKKDSGYVSDQATPKSEPVPPTFDSQAFANNINLHTQKQQQSVPSSPSQPPIQSQQHQPQQPPIQSQQHQPQRQHQPQQHPPPVTTAMTDFTIKQEVIDPHRTDRDLAEVLRQNFGAAQDVLNIQHSMASRPMFLPQNVILPTTGQSSVKQERPDWSGYGVMPNSSTNVPPVSTYPPYASFWQYLGCPTSSAFIPNPYQSIPNAQMPHPQVAATLSSAVTQANPNVPLPAATTTYNSLQEASSPAMSSQSNLTQASLDSLPKADSASTVANWLQNIPNMSVAQ